MMAVPHGATSGLHGFGGQAEGAGVVDSAVDSDSKRV